MPNPAGRPRKPLLTRFQENYTVSEKTGCWLWHGTLTSDGYARIREGGSASRNLVAHRWAYLTFVGEIPEGMVLDHLCRNRNCVNPAHLEPVTNRENIMRGVSVVVERSTATECIHGHPLSGDNLYIDPTNGWRGCKICRRKTGKAYRERNLDKERARVRAYGQARKDELYAKQKARRAAKVARAE